MFHETSAAYRAVFFPGSFHEPEPVVAEVKMPVPAFEAKPMAAPEAYLYGYCMTPIGEVALPMGAA